MYTYSMRTTIVCGLLGAGKTTFIQNHLQAGRERAVVLVNDFGKTGIDGEILSVAGIETIELPSGCVCCTLKFDLITTIEKVLTEFHPEHLIIEPSGVASPMGVIDALNSLKISQITVVGIIDASEFVEFYQSGMYGSFFEDQILQSNLILVNKTDLVEEDSIRETLQIVSTINTHAIVLPSVKASFSGSLPEGVHRDVSSSEGNHPFHYDTLSLRLDEGTTFAAVRQFFTDLSEGLYGKVVRAKALLNTDRGPYRFDLSSREVDACPFGRSIEENRLVIIGEELNAESIRDSISGNPT
jgi:G3E family GTPase